MCASVPSPSFLPIKLNRVLKCTSRRASGQFTVCPNTEHEILSRFSITGAIAMSKRDDYIEKMKLQLDKTNTKMNELDAKAKVAKADAREKYEEEMGKLRQQSQRALAKLEELRVAGEDSWDTMVAEMEKIRDAFVHSFKYFKSKL
jgi:hypothetical protein